MSRQRILILVDRRGWAYDSIAQNLVKYSPKDEVEIDVHYIKGESLLDRPRVAKYDRILAMGWQLLHQFDGTRLTSINKRYHSSVTVTGIHSHHSWDQRVSSPDNSPLAPSWLVDCLGKYSRVNAVSRRLTTVFELSGVDHVFYTPNGVDTTRFTPRGKRVRQWPNEVSLGYSGSVKHDWRKGVSEFISPLATEFGLKLVAAMPVDGKHVPLDNMPDFYGDVDIYLCASQSEGFSLSVLEAASSGCVIVSTRVGGCEDLIQDGVNGLLVDRDIQSMGAAIRKLLNSEGLAMQLRDNMLREIRLNWDWKITSKSWFGFLGG